MRRCSTEDLREKQVINLCDGSCLGCPTDFEFDICDGRVLSLIIAQDGGIFGFSKCDNIVIPWCKIECFGEDTILVKILPDEFNGCICCREKHKKKGKVKF